jgi:hypothetical protein
MQPATSWNSSLFGLASVPEKLSPIGLSMFRTKPFAVRMEGETELPSGVYDFTLRSRMYARLYVDGKLVLQSEPPKEKKLTAEEIAAQEAAEKKAREEAAQNAAAQQAREELLRRKLEDAALDRHDEVKKAVEAELVKASRPTPKSDTQPPAELQQVVAKATLGAGVHRFRLEVTGKQFRQEVSVVIRPEGGTSRLLTSSARVVPYTEKGWADWIDGENRRQEMLLEERRRPLSQAWEDNWKRRHAAMRTDRAPVQIDRIIEAKLAANGVNGAPVTNDYEFIRRIYLDVWGLVPSVDEARSFVSDNRPDKRSLLIDRLLADDRWADPWVSYWEDALAESPKLFGPVPNSTGPFKEWIYKSFVENRGYDRFATELILQEGTPKQFGTLGFRESFGNDAPAAEKAHVISQAFMAANMKCSRCHDSPLNAYKQRDLFGLAAMLNGSPVTIPTMSSVGEVPGRRKPAVSVTNKPGDQIPPSFVFDTGRDAAQIHGTDRDYRVALAEWMTKPRRFAEVGVNIIWKRFMATGMVEPADDWGPKPKISHPELLDGLANEFIASGYDIRHIQKLILKSRTYQRQRVHALAETRGADALPLFASPPSRRMRAEELTDSFHLIVGREFKSERIAYQAVDFGYPKRTWQIVSLSNEEDNAVLVKPLLQEIITTAKAFGWRDQRPDPVCVRNADPNPLQPLALANGELSDRLIKLTDQSAFTAMANESLTLDEFTDRLFLSTLSRPPSQKERQWVSKQLEAVWTNRRIPPERQVKQVRKEGPKEITIGDTAAAQEYIMKIRGGEPATPTLAEDFRKNFETVLWAMLNSPEFVFVP